MKKIHKKHVIVRRQRETDRCVLSHHGGIKCQEQSQKCPFESGGRKQEHVPDLTSTRTAPLCILL